MFEEISGWIADLCNAWVGTFDIPGGEVEPAAGVRGDGRTVLLHGASTLAAAPAALELLFRPQTHTTAVPLGAALVEVHCRGKQEEGLLERKKMKTRNVSLWVQVRHEKSLNGNKLGGWPHKLIPHGQQKMDGWKLWVRQWLKTCKKTTYSWHFPIQIYCGPQINCLFVWVMVFEKKTCICVLDGWTAAHQLTESKSQLQEDEY